MDTDYDPLSLISLMEGAAVEMFDRQMARVCKNIGDVNTDLKPREITLKVQFTPSQDRSYVVIRIKCPPAKLSGQDDQQTAADLKIDNRGRFYAKERGNPQKEFDYKFSRVVELNRDTGE